MKNYWGSGCIAPPQQEFSSNNNSVDNVLEECYIFMYQQHRQLDIVHEVCFEN
jgi:hypothetical protein